MKFKFHGMNTEVELESGNLITYTKVDGSYSIGILLGWELDVFKSPTFSVLRENGVVRTINKNMIYWCKVIA
jgi:hypothetical protein